MPTLFSGGPPVATGPSRHDSTFLVEQPGVKIVKAHVVCKVHCRGPASCTLTHHTIRHRLENRMETVPSSSGGESVRLQEAFASKTMVVMPGVFDGFSCRLAEQYGFNWALISGAGLSESHLGYADMGLMTGTENVEWSRRLVRCTGLNLIADGDTGYGNALNVYFLVKEFEEAGVSGVMIEDQVWPKRCGHLAGKEVIRAEEMVEKVRAAHDARKNPDFIIKARTDARGPIGLSEAIRRGNLYAEAGADLIFADALLSADEIRTFVKEVRAPVAINMGFGIQRRTTTPLLGTRELQEIGVAVVEYPRLLTAAAIRGMKNALDAFQTSLGSGEVVERPDLMTPFEELNDLVGLPELSKLEQRYLTKEQLESKYGE